VRTFGFIPRDQDDEENDAIEVELHTLRKVWDARQLADALVADQMLKDSHEALFEQVRTYAGQLEALDPETHNAAQEVSKVVLALSYAETTQERLDALTSEAGRLMRAVVEAKRQRENTKPPTKLERLAPYASGLFLALVIVIIGGIGGILVGLLAEGG
jgi:hypothetical protein